MIKSNCLHLITSYSQVPVVLFWETVDIDLSLIVDPNKLIGYGRGDIPTTILITMYHQGTKLISKFKHISFTYKSEGNYKNKSIGKFILKKRGATIQYKLVELTKELN